MIQRYLIVAPGRAGAREGAQSTARAQVFQLGFITSIIRGLLAPATPGTSYGVYLTRLDRTATNERISAQTNDLIFYVMEHEAA